MDAGARLAFSFLTVLYSIRTLAAEKGVTTSSVSLQMTSLETSSQTQDTPSGVALGDSRFISWQWQL